VISHERIKMDFVVTNFYISVVICETDIVTLKCRTSTKALYWNLCQIVMLDSLSCSITSISFLTNSVTVNKVKITTIHLEDDDWTYAFFYCFLNIIDRRFLTQSITLYNGRRSQTKLYDKRHDFIFPVVNFHFIISNIPTASAYRVYIS